MDYKEIKLLEDLRLGKHSIQYEDDPNDILIPIVGTEIRVTYDYQVMKNTVLRKYKSGRVEIIQQMDYGKVVREQLYKHTFFIDRVWKKAISLKHEVIEP